MSTKVPKHPEGAPPANQNARKHGWTSRRNPAPIGDILDAADQAANRDDLATLRKAKRALEFRGQHAEAHRVAEIIELVLFRKRENTENALQAPERLPYDLTALPTPPAAPSPQRRDESRIARAFREHVPWERGPE